MAQNPKRRKMPNGDSAAGCWQPSRCLGFRALWDVALYGISRSMGLRALWDFALYGTSRSMGLRALWLLLSDCYPRVPRMIEQQLLHQPPSTKQPRPYCADGHPEDRRSRFVRLIL